MSKERFVCIHGHFYQPPRENPWLESIELQDSAYPYHDWNERITAECYATNATSRVLDAEGRIDRIVNNYAKISFNFGPTLLSWMEQFAPLTYDAILAADQQSRDRFEGHGSALAQAYNHMIMPLANKRDKRCQVLWGLADFRHRFGREPEGMWLAETAVDLETLQILAEHGIRYTVLAPGQASRVRKRETGDKKPGRWRDVSGAEVDPSTAYELKLPSGKTIALFFYDGPVSQAVAFEHLLEDGVRLADRILGGFSDDGRDWTQLVHIATDGETYGHHHRHGEMALSYALEHLEREGAKLINYGAFLEQFPPKHQVEIHENSSWSCVHGIERWRSNCGCNSGGRPGWHQEWRAPLRAALDWLRDELAPLYERHAGELLRDPWLARNEYIDVLLDRTVPVRDRYLVRHRTRPLAAAERIRAWKLLELQRHAMLMYTSCGWFFDELSGIETVQVIQYAARAMQLAREVTGIELEPAFLERLERAPSNLPEHGNGRGIYEKFVQPAMVDLQAVAAHYAVSLPFEDQPVCIDAHGHRVERSHDRIARQGRAQLAIGRLRVVSRVTEEQADLSYGVLHFGDHNLTGAVRPFRGDEAFESLVTEVTAPFDAADLPAVLRVLDTHFEELSYSLRSLFRDEQRQILGSILESTVESARALYEQLYEQNLPLMRFLGGLRMPLPRALRAAAEAVLNHRLRVAVDAEPLDLDLVRSGLQKAEQEGVTLDTAGLSLGLQRALERLSRRTVLDPPQPADFERLEQAASLVRALPFEVNLRRVENAVYGLVHERLAALQKRGASGDLQAGELARRLESLGRALNLRVPQ